MLEKIFVSWRQGRGKSRYLIGELVRIGENFQFKYNFDEVFKARKEGFESYPDFPDIQQTYNHNLPTVFKLRLMSRTRPDREQYLSFWYANNPQFDWFDELGFTQGKLATDNFEFLADFPVVRGLIFLSEAASLSHNKIKNEDIEINDRLTFELDTNNEFDSEAVKLFKNNLLVGYVKRGHTKFFKKVSNDQVEIRVKSVDRNGNANQIYYTLLNK